MDPYIFFCIGPIAIPPGREDDGDPFVIGVLYALLILMFEDAGQLSLPPFFPQLRRD